MKLLNFLIAHVKYWKDYFQSDVSIVVEDLCEYMRYCPGAFEITQEGNDVLIGLKDAYMRKHYLPARIRLGSDDFLTLDMEANPRTPVNVREFKKLDVALDLWLSDKEQLA